MVRLTRVIEEKKSLQLSLNEYVKNHCNCDKVFKTLYMESNSKTCLVFYLLQYFLF